MKIQATEVSICIFTPKPFSKVSQYPDDEQRMYNAFVPVILDLREKWGSVPVYLDFCPLTITDNQLIVARAGIASFPAAQIFATYPDGEKGQYILQKDLNDRWKIDWNPDEVAPFVEALLYRLKPADSFLCKLVPELCEIGKYIWLGLAGAATYKFATTENPVSKVAWGAGAGILWNEYLNRV